MTGRFRRVDEIAQDQAAAVGANTGSFASSMAGIRQSSAS